MRVFLSPDADSESRQARRRRPPGHSASLLLAARPPSFAPTDGVRKRGSRGSTDRPRPPGAVATLRHWHHLVQSPGNGVPPVGLKRASGWADVMCRASNFGRMRQAIWQPRRRCKNQPASLVMPSMRFPRPVRPSFTASLSLSLVTGEGDVWQGDFFGSTSIQCIPRTSRILPPSPSLTSSTGLTGRRDASICSRDSTIIGPCARPSQGCRGGAVILAGIHRVRSELHTRKRAQPTKYPAPAPDLEFGSKTLGATPWARLPHGIELGKLTTAGP